MKKSIVKGVIMGLVIALTAVAIISVFFPGYTCLDETSPICSRILTPTVTAGIFIVLIVLGGGIGWISGRKQVGTTMK